MPQTLTARLDALLDSADRALESQRRWVVALFCLALFLKLVYIVESAGALAVRVPIMDSLYYSDTAKQIASGNFFRDEAFFMGPLYPYVLSVIYSILGSDPMPVRLVQIVGGSFSVVLTFMLGRALFRPVVGYVAALILCFYGAMTFYEGQLLMTWLGTLLNLSALVVLVRAGSRNDVRFFAAAGALIGISALARANILLFLPVAVAWIVWVVGGDKKRKNAIVMCVATVVTLLPATIHNAITSRDFVLVTSNAGINFYIGNSLLSTGIFYPPPGTDFVTDVTGRSRLERTFGEDLTPSRVSRFWFRKAFKELSEKPKHAVWLWARKAAMFFNGYEVPQIESYGLARHNFRSLRLLFIEYWWLGALGLLGIVFSLSRWRRYFLLFGFVAAYALSIIIFFVTSRYRVQIVPLMCLFAAHALLTLAPRYIGSLRRAVAFVGSFAVIMLLTQPALFALDDRVVQFTEYVHQARRFDILGDHKDALDRINRAIELYPDVAQGYTQRAIIHKSGNDELAAMEDLARAIDLDPDVPESHYDLAQSFRRMDLPAQAVAEYLAAIELDPYMVEAHNNLGITFRDMGRVDDAIRAFRTVITLDPKYTKAYNNLGACLAESGKVEEAIDTFREAIRIDPEYPNSYRNLAMAYISTQQPRAALEAMTKYSELAPEDEAAREIIEKLKVAIDAGVGG